MCNRTSHIFGKNHGIKLKFTLDLNILHRFYKILVLTSNWTVFQFFNSTNRTLLELFKWTIWKYFLWNDSKLFICSVLYLIIIYYLLLKITIKNKDKPICLRPNGIALNAYVSRVFIDTWFWTFVIQDIYFEYKLIYCFIHHMLESDVSLNLKTCHILVLNSGYCTRNKYWEVIKHVIVSSMCWPCWCSYMEQRDKYLNKL